MLALAAPHHVAEVTLLRQIFYHCHEARLGGGVTHEVAEGRVLPVRS